MFCPVSESCLVFFFYELSGLFSKSLAATTNTELEIPLLTIQLESESKYTFLLFAELLWNFLIQKLLAKIHVTWKENLQWKNDTWKCWGTR